MRKQSGRLIVNMSSVAPHPMGLGSYATRICAHVAEKYYSVALAPPHVALPHDMGRISTPSIVAIGGARSRALRAFALARRQLFYMHGPIRKTDFVYNPTHHGFFNTRNQIITIHDLISLHYPENFPRQAYFWSKVMPRLIARSRAVFTISDFTKSEIVRFFGIDPDTIYVVPNSFDSRAVPSSAVEKEPFLLIVGCHLPHKNVDEVLRLASLWKHDYSLKIVGATGYYGTSIRTQVRELGLESVVKFLPFIDDAELDRLYRRASALLYPSKMEGFGLPPLEALARGTLTIASDIPVHREVLGDAALFVELGSELSWSRALANISRSRVADIDASARQVVLNRYSPEAIGQRFDDALLAVAPEMQGFLRS